MPEQHDATQKIEAKIDEDDEPNAAQQEVHIYVESMPSRRRLL